MNTSENATAEPGISLLLRLPSTGSSIERVAEAHNRVINEHGAVWLGIVGKTYSPENVVHIKNNGEFLYLVQKTNAGTSVYRGKMADISRSIPEGQYSLIPPYYRDLGIAERAKLWVKLSSLRRIASQEIEKLRVVSSGKNASALLSGMAYLGIVERK